MNRQKGSPRYRFGETGLAPILIILLIALAIGGYLIYQKQTKPAIVPQVIQPSPSLVANSVATSSAETVYTEASRSANWKTFHGQYFSFQYPESWKEEPLRPSQNPRYTVVGSTFFCSTSSIFTASASNISPYPTLESYLRMGRWLGASPTKTVVLDGLSANYYEDLGDPGSSNPAADVVLYSPSKGIVVDLYFVNSCGESFQQIKTDFASIISTFKFTQ